MSQFQNIYQTRNSPIPQDSNLHSHYIEHSFFTTFLGLYLQLGRSAWNPVTGSPQSKVFFNGSNFWSPSDTKSETESPPCLSIKLDSM